jgi:hypothetical protein
MYDGLPLICGSNNKTNCGLDFFKSIEALSIEVPTEVLITKVVAKPIAIKSKWQKKIQRKKKIVLEGAPQLRSLINHTNILKIQYNKATMVDINKNSKTARNEYKGKTHINNIIFCNMRILQHKP